MRGYTFQRPKPSSIRVIPPILDWRIDRGEERNAFHGAHNWITQYGSGLINLQLQHERGDIEQALDVAWKSSPVASVSTWKSRVLLIQRDDDRNVRFRETVDLARRLPAHGVHFEELVIPDEIHGFLRYTSWRIVDRATVNYFDQQFGTR